MLIATPNQDKSFTAALFMGKDRCVGEDGDSQIMTSQPTSLVYL